MTEPDNSIRACTRCLRRYHRRVRCCKHCGRVLRCLVWQGVGKPSHAPGAWRLWRPMEDDRKPCAWERWDERRRTERFRKRRDRTVRETQHKWRAGRYLALLREKQRACQDAAWAISLVKPAAGDAAQQEKLPL